MIWDDEINDDYDFKRLRKDLETEYMIQGIGFTGDFGLFGPMRGPHFWKNLQKAMNRGERHLKNGKRSQMWSVYYRITPGKYR